MSVSVVREEWREGRLRGELTPGIISFEKKSF